MKASSKLYSYIFLVVGTLIALLVLSASIGVFIAFPNNDTTLKIIYSIVFVVLAIIVEVVVYVFFRKFIADKGKEKATAEVSQI